jgi:glyoxylase-like metal-dependent hydrolase (beta-lactamase superfamily II)
MSTLPIHVRILMPRLLKWWDGGPVKITDTFKEGDEIAGFEVVALPGHAPGLIGLWRAADRLALVSDCFYTLDPQTGIHGRPRVPHEAFNHDTEQARASVRKLAAMEPAAAWAGHADPLTGDVRGQLEAAAATT